MAGYSRKEADFFGNEKMVHYDGHGRKVGESRNETSFFGGEKTVHYDNRGRKTGESRNETSFFGGEKAVHYDDCGRKNGESKIETTLFGGEKVVHYDRYGRKVGESREEESLISGKKIAHYGEQSYSCESEKLRAANPGKFISASAAAGATVGGTTGAIAGVVAIGITVVLLVLVCIAILVVGPTFLWTTDAVIDFNGDMVDKAMSSVSVGASILYLLLGLFLTFRRKQSFAGLYYAAVAVTMALADVIVEQLILGEQVLSIEFFFAVPLLSLMFALPGMLILKICSWICKKEKV